MTTTTKKILGLFLIIITFIPIVLFTILNSGYGMVFIVIATHTVEILLWTGLYLFFKAIEEEGKKKCTKH